MKTTKLEEKEIKEIKEISNDKNKLTLDFGRLKTDMILVKAQLLNLEKMDEDMVARFKGNESKGKKMMDKMNKKYGDGTINIEEGVFTPSTNKKD